tara:strand:+ start:185 stop:385 length:201 start_codon:yes stop_codon:yes gene_type:complete
MMICDARDICDIVEKAAQLAEEDGEFFDMVLPQHTEREYIGKAMESILDQRREERLELERKLDAEE